MTQFEQLCNGIVYFERQMLENGYRLGECKDIWERVTFDELADGIKKYGDPVKRCYGEVTARLEDYLAHIDAGASDERRLTMMWNALEIIDAHLNTEILKWYFGEYTPQTLAELWREQDEAEKEAEARADTFEICKNVLMRDGCLTESEAEDFLFEMGY